MTAMPPGSWVPWAPEDLPIAMDEFGSWSYVVLEEIVDDVAVLRRWPWPVVDPLGRLLWPGGAEQAGDEVAVDVRLLKSQLYKANGLARQPRCGDTFATRRPVPGRRRDAGDLRTLLGDGEMYDVSADAREAAKIAYQSSLGAIRPGDAADEESVVAVDEELQRRAAQRLPALHLAAPPIAGATR